MSTVPSAVLPTCALAFAPAIARMMVSLSPTFQARASVADWQGASRSVTTVEIRSKLERAKFGYPLAVIETLEHGYELEGLYTFLPKEHSLLIVLQDRDRYPTSRDDSATDFRNFTGGVIADLIALNAGAGPDGNSLLAFQAIKLALPPVFPRLRDQNPETDYWMSVIELNLLDVD